MLRRLCRECGQEMTKQLTPEGPKFFCQECGSPTLYDEFDMDPYCPQCGEELEFCSKCSQGFFCNGCNTLVSRKRIVWKKK